VPLSDLCSRKEEYRPQFYHGLDEQQTQAFEAIEAFITSKEWTYGLDPEHGRMIVIPAGTVVPEVADLSGSSLDEILLFISRDPTGTGLCVTVEMVMPFYSEDDAVMEDSLLYAPLLPYGTLFLEENGNDRFLDLIYRVAFPLFPPEADQAIFARLFGVAAGELRELFRYFSEYPEEQ
jgi:hypothetical protein